MNMVDIYILATSLNMIISVEYERKNRNQYTLLRYIKTLF